ncbi:MAG: nucleotidyltransferase domain-containing protein [Bacteroidales bacterium]|jgi:predicted nucleotidyltransferase|nr:nucleotidyltransferase domain-containing protein [Bacteroidales bacterium]
MKINENDIEQQTGLSNSDMAKIISIFAEFPALEKVWLYGSRAKGNFQPYSDIDITLQGNALNIEIQHQIEWALDDLFLPYTFDVSILSAISNQNLLAHINRVGILIYEKET